MAIVSREGKMINYECSNLIEELKENISKFGGDRIVATWCKYIENVCVYVNYDFVTEKDPVKKIELKDDEFVTTLTMFELLSKLEIQNKII